jgi:hypothetical protein
VLPGGVRQLWPMIVGPPKPREEAKRAAPEASHV